MGVEWAELVVGVERAGRWVGAVERVQVHGSGVHMFWVVSLDLDVACPRKTAIKSIYWYWSTRVNFC